ncbi:MAG TPA: S53 family peptidase [Verrucomicrobiae bacterium]|nr:S53 family peptidase [Verrucomicrobiae bacterium]
MRCIRFARLLAAASVALLGACAQSGSIPAPLPQTALRDLGERAPGARVSGVVVLRDNHYDELVARVDAMADPDSASFHRFVTPEAFMERYAPTAQQQQSVIAALRSGGFSIDRTYPNRGLIDVSASSADAERFFSTAIHDFDLGGTRRFGNVEPLVVPQAIAPYVLGAILNDWESARADSALLGNAPRGLRRPAPVRRAQGNPLGNGPGKPLPDVPAPYPYSSAWSPYDLADAFDFPVQSGWNGAGVSAGIIIDSNVKSSDLAKYFRSFKIHRTGTIVQKDVLGPPNSGDALEATLDTETIAGLAPAADVIVYVIPDLLFTHMADGFNAVVAAHAVKLVNSSFGACDQEDVAFDEATEQTVVNGNALGMTFSASSGDQGVMCYDTPYQKGVEAPASDPHVSALGGNQSVTSMTSSRAWNTCTVPNVNHKDCATNGGISSHWTLPSYQQGIAGSFASKLRRNVPDLAFPAYDDYIVLDGQGEWIVGTSWASPTYVALMVQAAQACKTSFGAANVTTYALLRKLGEGVVTEDVVSGNNNYHGNVGYTAGKGFDDTTGLGLPLGSTYAAAMCKKR